jgi:ribosomal protein S18 acetylase RimI-like enzyme
VVTAPRPDGARGRADHGTDAVDIRSMTHDDVPAVSAAQARAFYDDPLQVWTFPDDATRLGVLEEMFLVALPVLSLRHGECYVDPTGAVAALWVPPSKWPFHLEDGDLDALASLRDLLGPRGIERQQLANDAMGRAHPLEPHWYLQGLGTDPAMQRRGYASAALAPVLARCDADAMPAYLESTKLENVAFYERHGFVLTGTIEVPRHGPRLYSMWRDPRP